MAETLTVPFGETDERHLRAFKRALELVEEQETPMNRRVIEMPRIEATNEEFREQVEEALDEGLEIPRHGTVKLPRELVENAKATFIATGGNISEVSALYDLTPEAVIRLAAIEEWPVYGGGTKSIESRNKAQLRTLQVKLWHKIEAHLDSLEVEKKTKDDIVQYRSNSEYVEALSSRSTTFKTLMDQYMRIGALLEPEIFAADIDPSNIHAAHARSQKNPGGIEGVNRELADLLSDVMVNVVDKARARDLRGYGDVIDARVVDE